MKQEELIKQLEKQLEESYAISRGLYLQRQTLEIQRQQLQANIQLVEMEMMKQDGKEEVLKKLIAQVAGKKDGE